MSETVFQQVERVPLTPMMRQYLAVKSQHPEHLVFYRMGDFYELFFEDATTAAPILEIALTKRGQVEGVNIPMCGVPFHAVDLYLQKLIRAGYSVAMCEQLETPQEAKKRSYKALVRRDVTKIVTPGTVLEEALLHAKSSNYLAAIAQHKNKLAIAWVELSVGEFKVATIDARSLSLNLANLAPQEIIVDDVVLQNNLLKEILSQYDKKLRVKPHSLFDVARTRNRLLDFFKVSMLSGFDTFEDQEIAAAGGVLEYVQYTQKSSLPYLAKLQKVNQSDYVMIDQFTRKHLELERNAAGEKRNSILEALDKTVTASGARLFAHYLSSPLSNRLEINKRLDNVEIFYKHQQLCANLRKTLSYFPDIERAFSRIYVNRFLPRDLSAISEGLQVVTQIIEVLQLSYSILSEELRSYIYKISTFDNLAAELKQAINTNLPANIKDGGIIKTGYSPQLDNLRQLKNDTSQYIEKLKESYRLKTGISTLKIQKNNIIGYFVEVTSSHSSKITTDEFVHKQSLGNAIRYTTEELKALEYKILINDEKIAQLELEIIDGICKEIVASAEDIALMSATVAQLDVFAALAEIAREKEYVRPVIDDSEDFIVVSGRHPVVEACQSPNNFTANDCILKENQSFWLITGPNMAGKSTFLRQNAVIAIMAQMGSFIPAASAKLGVVDRIFSRIGSGDNIASGQSTFMVEMLETAYILNNATSRSLVILDEIGRGTSTRDGLAIAWAVAEQLHNANKSKVLFATHYLELVDLEASLSNLSCYQVAIKEWEGKIIFLHQVTKGSAASSYGIQVAEMAGMPKEVIERAKDVLSRL